MPYGFCSYQHRPHFRVGTTYTSRILSVSDQVEQLLIGQESVEAASIRIEVIGLDWEALHITPSNALCTRKDLFHHLALVAIFDAHMTVANLWWERRLQVLVVAVQDKTLGVDISQLNETVLSLSVRALHDNVDSNDGGTCTGVIIAMRQEVSTHELSEFVLGDVEGNL